MTHTKYHGWQKQFLKTDKCAHRSIRFFYLLINVRTVHVVHLELQNVQLEFFPASCASKVQPCDLRIIQSFKVICRNQFMKKSFLSVESVGRRKSINILEAFHMISSAWERVGRKCNSSSFAKCGFLENRSDKIRIWRERKWRF